MPPPSNTFSTTWGGAFTIVRLNTFGRAPTRGRGIAAGRVWPGSLRRRPLVRPPGVDRGRGSVATFPNTMSRRSDPRPASRGHSSAAAMIPATPARRNASASVLRKPGMVGSRSTDGNGIAPVPSTALVGGKFTTGGAGAG